MLIETVGWRSIFWINIHIGLAAIGLTARFVPESRAPCPRPVDAVGQLLVMVALASLTDAIIDAPQAGWTSPTTLGLLALVLVAVGTLLAHEPRRVNPLLELRFFRSAPFSGATVIAIGAVGAFSGFLFLNKRRARTRPCPGCHAARQGRCGGCVHEPPGWCGTRRRGGRLGAELWSFRSVEDRFRCGQPFGMVDRRGLRARRIRHRRADDRTLGGRHRGADRAPVRRRRVSGRPYRGA